MNLTASMTAGDVPGVVRHDEGVDAPGLIAIDRSETRPHG